MAALSRAVAIAVAAVSGAALLSGCGAASPPAVVPSPVAPPSSPAPSSPAPSSPAPSSPGRPAPGAVATGLPPGAQPTLVRVPPSQVVLAGDGLAVSSGGAPRRLPFGTGSAPLRAALEPVLGRAPRTVTVACPAGRRTRLAADGFSVLLAGDRFAGWTESGAPDRDLRTAGGLGLQSSVTDLRAGLPGLVVSGRSWRSADGLSGRLDADGRVRELSGGPPCASPTAR